MENIESRLRSMNESIFARDAKLAEELNYRRRSDETMEEATRSLESMGEATTTGSALALETIVLRTGRPVLTIAKNKAILEFRDNDSQIWKSRLTAVMGELTKAIKSVGRIELQNDFNFDWVGTGWLVAEDIIVTNRHVASVFGRSSGSGFVFKQGRGNKTIAASIDFLEEADNQQDFTFKLKKILHIEGPNGPDIAFLQVEPQTKKVPSRILLFGDSVQQDQQVAVIGYPARDSRIPDQQLMINIFGDVFDKKRLAPGQITSISTNELQHDCSTLGGNSGSVVLDLESGKAVGLHFAGRFLEANFAVPANLISQKLKSITSSQRRSTSTETSSSDEPSSSDDLQSTVTTPATTTTTTTATATIANITIPLNISISVGQPVVNNNKLNGSSTSTSATVGTDEDQETFIEELPPVSSYTGRKGYTESFLGHGAEVPLPGFSTSLEKDVLTFNLNGHEETVLKYQHFSVVMSKARRQCFFSAVNIDGKTSFSQPRTAWRFDPRIPVNAQIMKECYGNPPKFSRGHMTRREDPIWGTVKQGTLGNEDSMHVTNTVPQMQAMNGGIWLELENYALSNARKDDMRISVFTGPVFKKGDPIQYGVKIPMSFWKIIAFIHDDTGELCATGYRISQKDFLQEEEFVFGKHQTAQVSIASIEKATGLTFGNLSDVDPLASNNEAALPPMLPINDDGQIIWHR